MSGELFYLAYFGKWLVSWREQVAYEPVCRWSLVEYLVSESKSSRLQSHARHVKGPEVGCGTGLLMNVGAARPAAFDVANMFIHRNHILRSVQ